MPTNKYNSPAKLLTAIRNILIGVLIFVVGSFIVGGVYLYGKVERIDERTAYLPSVNSLIVTQNELQKKADITDIDSFWTQFCSYIKIQEIRAKRQDSINTALLKLLIIRGYENDSIGYKEKEWLKEAKRICKHC